MVNVNHIGDSITGSVKGKTYGVSYTPEKFKELQELEKVVADATTREEQDAAIKMFLEATVEDFSTTVETACPYIHVNKATGQFFLKQGDKVSIHAMPKSFANRVLESVEKGISVEPMIKAWTRFLRNPFFSSKKAKKFTNYLAMTFTDYEEVDRLMNEFGVSKEVAIERATTLQTPLTQEGLVCSYKVSEEVFTKYALDEDGNKVEVDRYQTTKTIDEDSGEVTSTTAMPEYVEERVFRPAIMGDNGDAFYCGDKLGHQIKVGQKHSLPSWDMVDTNDNANCRPGLHIGGLDYIKGIHGETHLVFFDPMYLGAIPNDYNGVVRVKEYFVYDSMVGPVKSLYHSSKYAAECDEAWEEMRLQAIELANEIKADIEEDIDSMPE